MGRRAVRVALVVVDGFVAVTAIEGGIALLSGLETARFPHELLRRTPFRSYVAPDLILSAGVGGSALVAAAATLRRPDTGAVASMVAGVVMMGWIGGEILLLKQASGTHWTEG